VRDGLWRRARAVPSLDLRFAESKSLVDAVTGASLVTFTRASSGTVTDSAGVIQTAATDVPRFDHNPTTLESLGLLVEEQRTNLLLNSATLSTQSVTVAAAANTLSFYGTGTVTLTGVSTAGPLVGTGANDRVSLTFTPIVGVLILTVSGSVTNAQLEAGAFPTSYIPTTTAAVTRSADVASITGSAFSSWFTSPSENTFFVEYNKPPSAGQLLEGADGGSIVGISLSQTITAPRILIRHGSSRLDTAFSGLPTYLSGANRLAAATSALGSVTASNGALGAVAGSPAQSDWTATSSLSIGYRGAFNNERCNTTIMRLTYWPQRLSNASLQQITQ
jgi:hypothetical protein